MDGAAMSFEPELSIVQRWSRRNEKVAMALTSARCVNGRRRWALRLAGGGETIELPLNVSTPPGLELCVQTQTAVAWCAGMLLREIGASPRTWAGTPMFSEPERAAPEVRVLARLGSAGLEYGRAP